MQAGAGAAQVGARSSSLISSDNTEIINITPIFQRERGTAAAAAAAGRPAGRPAAGRRSQLLSNEVLTALKLLPSHILSAVSDRRLRKIRGRSAQ